MLDIPSLAHPYFHAYTKSRPADLLIYVRKDPFLTQSSSFVVTPDYSFRTMAIVLISYNFSFNNRVLKVKAENYF